MIDLSYRGEYTKQFEAVLSDLTGIEYVLATNTGTAALHLGYLVSGVEPNTEVLMPCITFVATANALKYIGAIPHLLDIDDYLGIDINKTKKYLKNKLVKIQGKSYNKNTGRKVSAIVPVHLFGIPVNMDGILDIAIDYNLIVVEDACQALGSTYKGDHVGAFGDCGALSFNGNKIITTGGGGALLTRKKNLYDQALHLATTGKTESGDHNCIAFNYRMSAWNALLGLSQIDILPHRIKANNNKYKNCKERVIKDRKFTKPNHWRIGINKSMGQDLWKPLSELPMYKGVPKDDLANAYRLYNEVNMI